MLWELHDTGAFVVFINAEKRVFLCSANDQIVDLKVIGLLCRAAVSVTCHHSQELMQCIQTLYSCIRETVLLPSMLAVYEIKTIL